MRVRFPLCVNTWKLQHTQKTYRELQPQTVNVGAADIESDHG